MSGLVQGDEAEERADGCEAGVAGARVVAAVGLEMAEEVAEQCGVEVVEGHRRGRLVQCLLGVAHQQPERRAIARDGVRAGLALAHEALGEEQGQQRREVGGGVHDDGLRAMRSRRRAASASSSGVAVRYQYVSLTWACPSQVARRGIWRSTSTPSRYHRSSVFTANR